MSEASGVPCVDLGLTAARDDAVRTRTLDELIGGLRDTGFVRVVGHGVDAALVDRVHGLFARFFELDLHDKMACGGVAGGQRGYTPFGVEHARDAKVADQKEFFHVGQEVSAGSPQSGEYPANVWPEAIPDLRPAALALYRALERTAAMLLRAIAVACSLPGETFASMIVDGNSILRAVHYPPRPCDADPRAMRAAPHEDINLITLLCGATDTGLELRSREDRWIEVSSRSGEIVADVGDMLARLTNGRLSSTTHRVVAHGESARRHRHSLPFFAHPRPECDLSVMAEFVADDEPARFPPITARAFLAERLREIGLVS